MTDNQFEHLKSYFIILMISNTAWSVAIIMAIWTK